MVPFCDASEMVHHGPMRYWLLVLWVVPLAFLSQGLWPVGILPMVLVTAWVFGAPRRPRGRDDEGP